VRSKVLKPSGGPTLSNDSGPIKGSLWGVTDGEEAEAAPIVCYKGSMLGRRLEKTIARCGLHVRGERRGGSSSPGCEKQ
jgi:hypothetical protein